MLRPFAFSMALESLLPRLRPPHRRPPVVWEDRAQRAAARLHHVTASLTRDAPSNELRTTFVQSASRETETAATHSGAIAALAVRVG